LEQVEREGVSVVVIDTLNGYLHSAVSEPDVLLHLRELISYLGRKGVVTLMTLTQHGVLGPDSSAPADISFLADNVFLMRYFEAQGSIRQALSMVKKRTGPHERTVRELAMSAEGLRLSQPLREFEGVLSGHPSYVGDQPLKRP
ncbi:MAG TPA: hypothetical protein VLT59_01400, partial [Steroidobacteraceae bacterium]|nr:hypothetical protein [Steroidobacteraceae bacterium]